MQKQEQKTSQTNPFSETEEEVLSFWEKNKIFEKSLLRPRGFGGQAAGKVKDYVFYDGPPFATGTPHYGHIVASIMKDVVPRYWTMRGYRVERRWGWDCHGLPIENIVEKEMGSKSKKDIIQKIGVEKFNELCRSRVLGYVEEWKKVMRRLGRWADMENAYKTMDLDFMESVWWVFKELYNKGLIYEGYRSMLICPRCETTLSQQEVAEGYKDIKDLSVTVKFEIANPSELDANLANEKVYILSWTTTPWTLIGNVALAVNNNIDHIAIESKNHKEIIIFAKERIEHYRTYLEKKGYDLEKFKIFKGRDLVGLKYKPPFDYYTEGRPSGSAVADPEGLQNGWKIYAGDFVTTDEGTGVVHIAPAFGEDDMNLGKKENLPFIQHVGMDGVIKKEAVNFAGLNVKPRHHHMETDKKIIEFLEKQNSVLAQGEYEHSYPHCWRCETPLINYATSSWFVDIFKIKEKMLKTARKINWSPKHIKEGRFGKWLEGARDWSISRQRFWASIIPIWRCDKETPQPPFKKGGNANTPLVRGGEGGFRCGNIKVIGSIKELEKLSGEKITDLHKHIIDKITFPCEKCPSAGLGQAGTMKRVPDVLDCWFESGSMPYAQVHYPFENKKKFEKNFPAEFIAEGIDQTRAWFYYLHAIANGIRETHAFKNVIVNGIVLAEDGKKMSKKLGNYPDPLYVFDKYGADALRYYLLTSPVMLAENLCFAEKGVKEALRNVVMILWNVYKFYELFTNGHESPRGGTNGHESDNVLDKWILARLNQLIKEVMDGMNNYNLPRAARPIEDFVNDFSTWYLRRSRERLKGDDEKDKKSALETTAYVLLQISKVIAPFMPFVAENLWQKVSGNNFQDENKSVHLEGWPSALNMEHETRNKILEKMEVVRRIVELGLAERDEVGIKVRQPIASLKIKNQKSKIKNEFLELIKEEVNVKTIEVIMGEGELGVELDTKITLELKLEGVKRELVRLINNLRKEAGMTIKDRAVIYYEIVETSRKCGTSLRDVFEKMGAAIMKDTLSNKIVQGTGDTVIKKEIKIDGEKIILGITKI